MIKYNITEATEEDLKNLYLKEGTAIEGLDLSEMKNPDTCKMILKKFEDEGFEIEEYSTIYIATGKLMNSVYDLEGDNAYKDDFHISIIEYDDCKFRSREREFLAKMKENLKIRWFTDIVDNNEYKEYIKGRHEKTSHIEWLIDKLGDREEE